MDAAEERDRALATINGVEGALRTYGVAITAPLADAVLDILEDRARLQRALSDTGRTEAVLGVDAEWAEAVAEHYRKNPIVPRSSQRA